MRTPKNPLASQGQPDLMTEVKACHAALSDARKVGGKTFAQTKASVMPRLQVLEQRIAGDFSVPMDAVKLLKDAVSMAGIA